MWWLLASSVAQAQDLTVHENTDWARDAVVGGDLEGARVYLDAAREAALAQDTVVPAAQLAAIWYLRGVVAARRGADEAMMDAWRQALVIDNTFPWDEELVEGGEKHALFEALRREVRDRDTVSTQVPDKTGAAKLYVDGERVRAGSSVPEGLHLAQITCDDGKTYGAWTDFHKKHKWLKMCPGGVDTSVVVEEEVVGFGLLPDEEDFTPEDPEEDALTELPSSVSRGGALPLAMLGGGGAMIAAGAVLNFVWVNPTWSDVDAAQSAPANVTRAQADELTAAFNTARWTTLGLLGGGVLLSGTGVLLDGGLGVGPSGLLVSGRF